MQAKRMSPTFTAFQVERALPSPWVLVKHLSTLILLPPAGTGFLTTPGTGLESDCPMITISHVVYSMLGI